MVDRFIGYKLETKPLFGKKSWREEAKAISNAKKYVEDALCYLEPEFLLDYIVAYPQICEIIRAITPKEKLMDKARSRITNAIIELEKII